MDFSAFKLDIDELIEEFVQGGLKTVADMKRLWLARKFSYIFEAARPSSNLAVFMQTLYSHSISHMNSTNLFLRRLGGLYCLYFLYEIQPFKPPFKIYMSLGELRWLKNLVVISKYNRIKVVSVLLKKMLEKNVFLFGFVSISEYSQKERKKELVDAQSACIHKLHEKLFANTDTERFLHMDLGMELDLEVLQKMSTEYATVKSLAVTEASEIVDVQNIEHITEDGPTLGNELQKIAEEWLNQKETFNQQTRSDRQRAEPVPERRDSQQEQPPADAQNQLYEEEEEDDEMQFNGSLLELLRGKGSTLNNDHSRPNIPTDQHLEEDNNQEYDEELEKELQDNLFGDLI